MINPKIEVFRSAPECQLLETGTASTYGILSKAVRSQSDRKLQALEEELSFYEETGLVGIHMSSLLVLLRQNKTAGAALPVLSVLRNICA